MGGSQNTVEGLKSAIHVLAVDDSAVVREILVRSLPDKAGLTVQVAADPVIAIRKIQERRPDVILLDLELPRIDGLTFLKHLMANDPIPVVICSGIADHGTNIALEALSEGAFDVLPKPKRGVTEFLEKSAIAYREILRAAVSTFREKSICIRARVVPGSSGTHSPRRRSVEERERRFGVVAIGTSTGGPPALEEVLAGLPTSCPGIAIVQHMPPGFTEALANRLNGRCRIAVKEAVHGDKILPGLALIAPGDRHIVLVRSGPYFTVALDNGPEVNGHKPSVDVLFRSVARMAGSQACGVILTGMGADGAVGLSEMRKAGAYTLGQSAESCAVYGMPHRAAEMKALDRVTDLQGMAQTIGSFKGIA